MKNNKIKLYSKVLTEMTALDTGAEFDILKMFNHTAFLR
jgi:hypothetical protein